jgi:hypothetical protein
MCSALSWSCCAYRHMYKNWFRRIRNVRGCVFCCALLFELHTGIVMLNSKHVQIRGASDSQHYTQHRSTHMCLC